MTIHSGLLLHWLLLFAVMNHSFLKKIHQLWLSHGLLDDTSNLDFATIPYWGNDSHLENNWSGKRKKTLASMLAIFAHNPDSGLIHYGNVDVLQKDESVLMLESLDFYREGDKNKENKLRYIVFDGKFTNYESLRNIDDSQVIFVTIRRREKLLLKQIDKLPASGWKTVRVDFDLTMSILAHNLYRLFANKLGRYSNNITQTLYDKFVMNGADIEIGEAAIKVLLKKKRQFPLILTTMQRFNKQKYLMLRNKNHTFEGATYS